MSALEKCIFFLLIIPGFLLSQTGNQFKYWIYFNDKGPQSLTKSFDGKQYFTQKALERRAKMNTNGPAFDFADFPVCQEYLDILKANNITFQNRSKWLNAVSAYLSREQIEQISQYSFIKEIQPVLTGTKAPINTFNEISVSEGLQKSAAIDYGPSLFQNDHLRIPEIHDKGITGQGVLIAVLDTGYRLTHPALEDVHVVDSYDFIHNDSNVDNEEENQDVSSQNHHGTYALSVIAGYKPGALIGTAFGADFLLAKTEDMRIEAPVEEDHWIAAAEWADSLGADIISSSIGYLDWYIPEDMDGKTAPISIAADIAVSKGITVVTSAGNEGNISWEIISAPADAFNVISVGSVFGNGNITSYSSRGPTADGRIKPEVVALGEGIVAASTQTSGYVSFSGTSASCPLVTGVAALILSAHPGLTPEQVREAIINTADRNTDPNNTYGYGLVNAIKALNYWGETVVLTDNNQLGCYPNPFNPANDNSVRIIFNLEQTTHVNMSVYNVLGQKIKTLWNANRPAGNYQRIYWNGTHENGEPAASGSYFCYFKTNNTSHTIRITLLR